ncbi:MAG: hypothetical protein AAGA20_08615 [Planctomycetota bacterium]
MVVEAPNADPLATLPRAKPGPLRSAQVWLRRRLRQRRESSRTSADECFLGVVSRDPLIVYHLGCDPERLVPVHEALGDRDLWILRGADWEEEGSKHARNWADHAELVRKRWPRHRVVLLHNTRSSCESFRRYGLLSIFCHHNALLDEKIFRVRDDAVKEFAAVYTARITRMKRIELAAQVSPLALLTYGLKTEPGLFEKVWGLFDEDAWLNLRSGEYRRLDADEMADVYARSRVGLMLSPKEGGNYASCEYFLSGLPLVSTPSLGGRDVFYDDRFVRVVEPDPASVARGVDELIALDPDPHMIREATIERMEWHRDVLRRLLDDICAEARSNATGAEIWDSNFYSKLCRWQSTDSLVAEIEGE